MKIQIIPLLLMRALNVHREPFSMYSRGTYRCFMRTEMDVLVLGNCFLSKNE